MTWGCHGWVGTCIVSQPTLFLKKARLDLPLLQDFELMAVYYCKITWKETSGCATLSDLEEESLSACIVPYFLATQG